MADTDDSPGIFDTPPPPGLTPPPPPPARAGGGGGKWLTVLILAAACALPAYGIFQWFFCRIEVEQGKFVVLIAKTGQNLPSGQMLAGPDQKGIRVDTLGEGRHFRNPFFWDWWEAPIAEVPPGRVGILTRLFGKVPEGGRILAEGGLEATDPATADRGILRDILRPGRYRVNPLAYRLDVHDAVEIKPGSLGVVTNLVGATPKTRNAWLVEPGERGVQKTTLGPGVHYVNPFAVRIDPIDVRQRRFEFTREPAELAKLKRDDPRYTEVSDHVAITFPSSDGFDIEVKLTVTWQVDPERAPETFVRISRAGDVNQFDADVIHTVLTPVVRGFARVEGSKVEANQYISGRSRATFQQALLEKCRASCGPLGILIHEVLVSDIVPPGEIADPIRQREIAKEELARNLNQIRQAQAEQTLARETELVKQGRVKVESETARIKRVITAKNQQAVAMIDQEKLLQVARTDLAAAEMQAKALLSRGQAEADVIMARNEAEAEPLRRSVEAFKSAMAFANYTLAQRIAPSVRSIFADPASAFGKIFSDLLEPAPASGARKGE